jgi:hypothetical protein
MEVASGSISWVNALAFNTERNSAALITNVGKFQHVTLKKNSDYYTLFNLFKKPEGWVWYDVEGVKSGRRDCCVVIGRTKEKERDIGKKYYYILVVLLRREDGEYTRIGVGMVRTGCIKRLRASVRIV